MDITKSYNIIAINETSEYNDAAIKKTGTIYCLYLYDENVVNENDEYILYPLYNIFENKDIFEPHFKFFEELIDDYETSLNKNQFNDVNIIHIIKHNNKQEVKEVVRFIQENKLDIDYEDIVFLLKNKGYTK